MPGDLRGRPPSCGGAAPRARSESPGGPTLALGNLRWAPQGRGSLGAGHRLFSGQEMTGIVVPEKGEHKHFL